MIYKAQRTYGLGKFFKKAFWQGFRPRHILRRLGWGAVGSVIAGPLGYYAGRWAANRKAWEEETDRYGHSFGEEDPERDFSESWTETSVTTTESSINGKGTRKVISGTAKGGTGRPTVSRASRRVIKFSDTREDASAEVLRRAKTTGVVQKIGSSWRIVSVKKGKLWDAHYGSREKAEAALRGYQANK